MFIYHVSFRLTNNFLCNLFSVGIDTDVLVKVPGVLRERERRESERERERERKRERG